MNIKSGSKFLVSADPEESRIVIYLVGTAESRVAEARIQLTNVPGAIARIAQVVTDEKIDIITSTFPPSREETTTGAMLLDLAKTETSLAKLATKLKTLQVVKKVIVRRV
jgi:ACT domain-containing protein